MSYNVNSVCTRSSNITHINCGKKCKCATRSISVNEHIFWTSRIPKDVASIVSIWWCSLLRAGGVQSSLRAPGWHNLFSSSAELLERLRLCHSMPTLFCWLPSSRMSENAIWIKAKGQMFNSSSNGIKEPLALTGSDNIIPGTMCIFTELWL